MAKGYGELTRGNLCKSGARSFLAGGSRVSITLRIPRVLQNSCKREAVFCGIGFYDFVCTCMIKDLAKKGA